MEGYFGNKEKVEDISGIKRKKVEGHFWNKEKVEGYFGNL